MHQNKFVVFFILVFPLLAFADEVTKDLYYECDPKNNHVWLKPIDKETTLAIEKHLPYSIAEELSTLELVTFTPEDEYGNVYRTRSETIIRTCGKFKILISSGFLNRNSQGEQGTVSYPIVVISSGDKVIASNIALGRCDKSLSRYSYMNTCPNEWAVELEAFYSSQNEPLLSLSHTYEELIELRKPSPSTER